MTSLCHKLWQFILAQGFVIGLGSGALFLTAVAIKPTWFTSRKSLAIGIVASGSSVGGMVYPIVFRYLEPQVGLTWAVRTIELITPATNAAGCVFVRIRREPNYRRALFDSNLFKDLGFDIWSMAWFFGSMGMYVPYFFVQDYANEMVGEPTSLAF